MISRFKKLIFKNDDIQRFQEEVSKVFNSITDSKIIDGVIARVSIINGDTEYLHRLQRPITGIILIHKTALGDYYIKQKTNEKIVFTGNASFSADFWIF